MDVKTLDLGAAFHHGHRLAQHRRHMEHVGDAVALEHVGEAFRPTHFSVVSEHGEPSSLHWETSVVHGAKRYGGSCRGRARLPARCSQVTEVKAPIHDPSAANAT